MTRYDIAKFYGYNSPEEYEEAQRRKHEIFVESKKMQKPNAEKEPVERGRWALKNRQISDVIVKLPTECTNCGFSDFNAERYNFCPNCGARMMKDGDTE